MEVKFLDYETTIWLWYCLSVYVLDIKTSMTPFLWSEKCQPSINRKSCGLWPLCLLFNCALRPHHLVQGAISLDRGFPENTHAIAQINFCLCGS